jgi:hypothetical protein
MPGAADTATAAEHGRAVVTRDRTPATVSLSAMPKECRRLARLALDAGWTLTFNSNQTKYCWKTPDGAEIVTTGYDSDRFLKSIRGRLVKAGLDVDGARNRAKGERP